jgi:histone deacetylase 6
VNIPWAESGTTDADYIHAFQQIVMPIATEFAPELVISKWGCVHPRCSSDLPKTVSAGFDAADGDILGECCVTPAGYAHMTYMLSTLAGGKVVAALEVSLTPETPDFCLMTVGRIHARVTLQLCVGCRSNVVRRGPSRAATSSGVRGRI